MVEVKRATISQDDANCCRVDCELQGTSFRNGYVCAGNPSRSIRRFFVRPARSVLVKLKENQETVPSS